MCIATADCGRVTGDIKLVQRRWGQLLFLRLQTALSMMPSFELCLRAGKHWRMKDRVARPADTPHTRL